MDREHLAAPPSEMEIDILQRLTPQQLAVQLVVCHNYIHHLRETAIFFI